ncbi:MAG: ribonuclease H-like domain-containing protein [Candidatus Magasanikbacteria bacterium]|nr:ribonuclease H-like domain-containing protein [Candidatus Magasanikbacteria bacterium]
MFKEVVIDIETQNTFLDVGQGRHQDLKVSIVCGYSYADDKFFTFRESELVNLWPILEKADRVIGYNSRYFDMPVLNNYYPGDLDKVIQLDMLEEIKKVLGFRLKLNDVAKATLGTAKSGNGLDAVEWFKKGEWDKIEKYCLDDVKITKEVYEYGLKNKQLFYPDLQSKSNRPFPVNFSMPEKTANTAPTAINLTLPF